MLFQRFTHPLDLLDAVRRWLPGAARWNRDSARLRPNPKNDWLLEPTTCEEAQLLFPQLQEDDALLQYQRLKLQLREREGRGF